MSSRAGQVAPYKIYDARPGAGEAEGGYLGSFEGDNVMFAGSTGGVQSKFLMMTSWHKKRLPQYWPFLGECHDVDSSQMTNIVEFWCFLCCRSWQAVEQTAQLFVIETTCSLSVLTRCWTNSPEVCNRDDMMLMSRHCKVARPLTRTDPRPAVRPAEGPNSFHWKNVKLEVLSCCTKFHEPHVVLEYAHF